MNVDLLPQKHVRVAESLLGIGALVLECLGDGPKSLDDVLRYVREIDSIRTRLHGSITLDSLILSVDFLFAIGALRLTSSGKIEHATS